MLMSDGVYKSLESATRTDHVNKELAQMAVNEVSCCFQTSLFMSEPFFKVFLFFSFLTF
jgi:hypothetical protein